MVRAAISGLAADSSEEARTTMCKPGLILRAESTTKPLSASDLMAMRPFAHWMRERVALLRALLFRDAMYKLLVANSLPYAKLTEQK